MRRMISQLLKILLAEHRDVRLDDVDSLATTADALEMPRAELAVQDARQGGHWTRVSALGHADRPRFTSGMNIRLHPAAAQHACVLLRRARVVREILVRPNCMGSRKYCTSARRGAAPLDEAHMPGMQIPHGGYEGHPPALAAPAAHALAHGGNRGDGSNCSLEAVFRRGFISSPAHTYALVLQGECLPAPEHCF